MRFTVRRPGQHPASPCSHRPSGGDIACRIHIGVALMSTGDASENRLALTVLWCTVPAGRTGLRREYGIDPLDSPCRTCHRLDVKVLNPYQVEASGEVGGGLLDPISSPIRFSHLQPGDGTLDPTAPIRPTFRTRQLTAQHGQPPLLPGGQRAAVEKLPRREGGRNSHTTIDAHDFAVARSRNRLWDHHEDDMPAAGAIATNSEGLDAAWHRTRPAEPHPTNLGHPDPTSTAIQPLNVLGLDVDLPKSLVLSGLAPRRPAMASPEEVRHGLREISQRLLLHHLRTCPQPVELGTRLRQLPCLLVIVWCGRAARTPVLMLFYRQVPDKPCMPGVLEQPDLLVGRREQTKTRHRHHRSRGHRQSTPLTRPSTSQAPRRVDRMCLR